MALVCPRYSSPCMLKVAPCTVVRSNGRTSKFFRLDGLLLFFIIMGLRCASATKNYLTIGNFTDVYLVAKHFTCSEAKVDLVVIETSILLA